MVKIKVICHGKQINGFTTENEAIDMERHMTKEYKKEYSHYFCDKCKMYHISPKDRTTENILTNCTDSNGKPKHGYLTEQDAVKRRNIMEKEQRIKLKVYHCDKCGDVYPTERKDEDMAKGDFECHCPKCGGQVTLVATTEDSAIHPSSVYGIGKQVQGQLVHLICKNIGIESVSFRYQNVYGPGQSLTNPYTGILSIFSNRIKSHKGINIFEDGKETRDFVYIDDVVDATIAGMEVPEANGHVFNVGTGIATDVLTVAQTLCKHYGIDVPLTVSGNYRLGDIRHNYADITLAKQILGFQPKWSFDAGIKLFTDWVNRQELQTDNYEASLEEMKQKGLFK